MGDRKSDNLCGGSGVDGGTRAKREMREGLMMWGWRERDRELELGSDEEEQLRSTEDMGLGKKKQRCKEDTKEMRIK